MIQWMWEILLLEDLEVFFMLEVKPEFSGNCYKPVLMQKGFESC